MANNPVLARMEQEAKQNGGYAGFEATTATATATTMAPAPVAAPAPEADKYQVWVQGQQAAPGFRPMAVADVVMKTLLMFIPLVITAFAGWRVGESNPDTIWWITLGSWLLAFGCVLWAMIPAKPNPVPCLLYAVIQGFGVGAISYAFATYVDTTGSQITDPTLVLQAVIGTFGAFAAMLFLYVTRIIKITSRVRRMWWIAMFGYLFVGLASVIASFFGVGDGFGFYGTGGWGLALCVFGVALAAFTLAMDFDAIERLVQARVPEQESWRGALGLVVTLVWLYLEILRLLAILRR